VNESQASLTSKQSCAFNQFLRDGTENAVNALETVFALDIDNSHSSMEFFDALNGYSLDPLCESAVYTVSSDMLGDLTGRAELLMREGDFHAFQEIVKPVLGLMFLSDAATNLEALETNKPSWLRDSEDTQGIDPEFQSMVLDMLAEIGNILIGLYSKALYRTFGISMHHSVPKARREAGPRAMKRIHSEQSTHVHLVIENTFQIMQRSLMMWCVISPTHESFREIMAQIEASNDSFEPPGSRHPADDQRSCRTPAIKNS
jgi:hypothetical protein